MNRRRAAGGEDGRMETHAPGADAAGGTAVAWLPGVSNVAEQPATTERQQMLGNPCRVIREIA
ncbi:hypothetical protein D3C83_110670 [compost metagenome]